jgi:hypothetical protein
VPVKVNDLLILVDSVVVDIHGEEEMSLILGKPFPATTSALIEDEQTKLGKEEAHIMKKKIKGKIKRDHWSR